MKVLDLINTAESAKELLVDRALYLERRYGVVNHVLCSRGDYVDVIRRRGVHVHVVDTPRGLHPVRLLGAYVKLVRLLRRERYDLVHSHGSVVSLLARLARPFSPAPLVYTVHGFHFHEHMSAPIRFFYEAVERILLRLTDLALSQNQEDLGIMAGWGTGARLEFIGNGIPLPREVPEYRAEEKDEYRLCCIARFEGVKNHRMLLDAFRRVLDAGVPARLTCYGTGELLEAMQGHAADLALGDRVEFPGYVDDVLARLEGTDLNLLTSVKEGLPRALIETMALGIPSVATDVKGSREVVADGVTGRLVPLNDVEGFADAVVHLLRDPTTRAGMSRAARKRARELFDEAEVCDRLFRLYAELVSPESEARERVGETELCGRYSCSS